MTEGNQDIRPWIESRKDGDKEYVYLGNVYQLDGSDLYALFEPDNRPYEADISGSGSLSLTEKQARFFHDWMGQWIKQRDGEYVHAFLRTHPRFGEQSAWALARSAGAAGIPFCRPCSDWHVDDEECPAGEGVDG
jgi:hypothetical protein